MKILSPRNLLSFYVFLLFTAFSCRESVVTTRPEVLNLEKDWHLRSSANIEGDGSTISTLSFNAENWQQTSVPSTVLAALVRNEVYQDVFMGDNFDKIPKEQFKVPWWYRTVFAIDDLPENTFYNLVFEGINYRANVWLNGRLVASADTVEQPFQMFDFSVDGFLKKGKNVLAVEIIPPLDNDLTIGWVDWNPWPADNNMGIWRPVKLIKTGAVSAKNIFVKPQLNVETLNEAQLTISADLENHSGEIKEGMVTCTIGEIKISQAYTLQPHEKKKTVFDDAGFPELLIQNPRVWWPNHLGSPELYDMAISVSVNDQVSDDHTVRFGIRDVKDYINDEGHRGYMINGKKVLIKGAGWVDDVLLDDSDEKVLAQIQYVKHMNMNTIRLEGFWGKNKKIYEYADENGILVMIGWSCQWEWEGYCGRPEDEYLAIRTPEEIELHANAYMDQVYWLRNHPSVFLWVYGSDKVLVPELETKLNNLLEAEDATRPVLTSCGSATSEVSGPSRVKMNGPYAYVTPNYWYVDDKRGGAFGFNTETGPGLQPPPIESIKKMIPKNHLWPLDHIWDYHTGRNEFATFKNWITPFNNRYGESENVEEFAFQAQMSNYEAIRPMFEAFAVNKPKTTGVIQWMLSSSQPGMLWQLYDWYLMPTAAFYGTRAACRPLNIVYNYKDKNIYITNDYYQSMQGLLAEIRILDIDSKEIFSKSLEVSVGENASALVLEMPVLKNLTTTYFVSLKLKNADGQRVADNFYWLSTKADVLDLEHSEWFVTRNTAYADFKGLKAMTKTTIDVAHEFKDLGEKKEVQVILENPTGQLAFFIELTVKGEKSGNTILPVFWDDNYVSLLPGEKKEVTGYFYSKDVRDDQPVFSYKGWNVGEEE
ncbi:MAG: glycoside hydrolase family 2 [Cyclobacteriaceae bacterium]|nr:glycoside hydrolase family 2 [Cyclobacteriaceae bacterium]